MNEVEAINHCNHMFDALDPLPWECEMNKDMEAVKKLLEVIEEKNIEISELKRKEEIKNAYLEMIYDVGFDYDGCESPKDLKELIDELIKWVTFAYKNNDKEVMYMAGNDFNKKFNILHEPLEV